MSSQENSGNNGSVSQSEKAVDNPVSPVSVSAAASAAQQPGAVEPVAVGAGNTAAAVVETPPVKQERYCSNCGHPMDGPFCGQCGQHEKSMIRFFGSVVAHFLDDIFGWDSRAGRTIVPLLFRPGFLTNEYFRGRRVHYVPPLRMYFIVSIIFFLALGLFTDDSVKDISGFQQNNGTDIMQLNRQIDTLQDKMSATDYVVDVTDQKKLDELTLKRDLSIAKVRKGISDLQNEIDEINTRRNQPGYEEQPEDEIQLAAFETSIALMQMNLDQVPIDLQIAQIDNQLSKLRERESAAEFVATEQHKNQIKELENHQKQLREQIADSEAGEPSNDKKLGVEMVDSEPKVHVNFGSGFDFLTDEQNKQLQDFGKRMEEKAKKAFNQDAGPLIQQILSVLPQAMFVLLPIFALLLKFIYIFSGRYYMEHLTVALHSHAFIFVNLLLLALLSTLYDVLADNYKELAQWVEYLLAGFALWSPIYLFLMQKRVYKQGVIFTALKFMLVGFCYVLLLSFTIAIAAFWGLYKL